MTTTLRLTQIVTAPDTYRIEFALEQVPRMTATAEFQYQVSAETQERIRWYLEEYPKALFKPDTELAKQVEKQIHTIGTVFFRTVFEANRDTQRLWDRIIDHVQDVRIEIETTVEAATALPWELLRDQTTDLPLALRAESFVRVQQEIAVEPKIPKLTTDGSAIRVLLVIARPDLGDDVAFRSVGAHLVKLTATHEDFALSVLRPPTWEQ